MRYLLRKNLTSTPYVLEPGKIETTLFEHNLAPSGSATENNFVKSGDTIELEFGIESNTIKESDDTNNYKSIAFILK